MLSPNGTISVLEGESVSLVCSSNLNDVTVTWSQGSTQLSTSSSTSSLTHTINNITRNESGTYKCTIQVTVGMNRLTKVSMVTIIVLGECNF